MKKLIYLSMLGGSFLLGSCENKMDEKHKNPDAFTETQIQYLFADGAIKTIESDYADWYNHVFRMLGTYLQTAARREGKDRLNVYDIRDDKGKWEKFYVARMSSLTEIDKIYNILSSDGKAQNVIYKEAGRILQAYNTIMTTDFFGNMPYSEAFTARNNIYGGNVILRPKYDDQKDIYYKLIDELADASAYFKDAKFENEAIETEFKRQDVIYGGDLSKWYKFANSLRLRCAMRISNVDEAKATSVIKSLNVADLILDNTDNAVLKIKDKTVEPNNSIQRAFRESHNNNNGYYYFAPQPMVQLLKDAADPRLHVFFQPASDDDGKVLEGATDIIGYPVSADDAINIVREQSAEEIRNTYGIYNAVTFRNNYQLPQGIGITAAEVAFYLSEAAVRGLCGLDAEAYYNKGILLSVQNYYGYYAQSDADSKVESIAKRDVSDAVLIDWLQNSTFAFNRAKALEQIATQKWLHYNIMQPFESWAEYRRTDLPVLEDDRESGTLLNKSEAPVRFLYPSSEASMNTENYNLQSEYNQPDVRLWWDVK